MQRQKKEWIFRAVSALFNHAASLPNGPQKHDEFEALWRIKQAFPSMFRKNEDFRVISRYRRNTSALTGIANRLAAYPHPYYEALIRHSFSEVIEQFDEAARNCNSDGVQAHRALETVKKKLYCVIRLLSRDVAIELTDNNIPSFLRYVDMMRQVVCILRDAAWPSTGEFALSLVHACSTYYASDMHLVSPRVSEVFAEFLEVLYGIIDPNGCLTHMRVMKRRTSRPSTFITMRDPILIKVIGTYTHSSWSIIDRLLELGADPNAYSTMNGVPCDRQYWRNGFMTALHLAIKNRVPAATIRHMLLRGGDVTARARIMIWPDMVEQSFKEFVEYRHEHHYVRDDTRQLLLEWVPDLVFADIGPW